MPRRSRASGSVVRFDLHPVIRTVMNSGFSIPGHGSHHNIWTAVHFMVTHHRKIEEVYVASLLYHFFYRGRFLVDYHWRDSSLLHFETCFGHFHATHFLG